MRHALLGCAYRSQPTADPLATRLAITGSGGYLAQQLITRLGSDPDVEFILGLDIRPREAKVKCEALFLRFDLTAPWSDLRDLFQSHAINTAMHLAWQFNPIHNHRRHRQVDIEGSRNLLRAAGAAGLKRVIYTSSTTAYVNPGNPKDPPFLSEETPVTGTPRYLYSKHKAEVDRMVQTVHGRASGDLGHHSQAVDRPGPAYTQHRQQSLPLDI